MVKAIIFDCFGVLVTEAWLPFKDKYFGDKPELYQEATDLAAQANRGLISHKDFIEGAARLAGVDPAEAMRFVSRNVPDDKLFDYVRELKKDFKLGFLSNIAENYLHRLFTDEQVSLFDIVELSYKTGYIKPEPEAYRLIAENLGVEMAEAVMVDDQQRNVDGAKAAGMSAILYKDAKQLRNELNALLANTKG